MQLVVCAILLVSPVFILAVFDEPKPFGGSSFREFPSFSSLWTDSSDGRDVLAEALAERMRVKKWSISTRNWIDLEILGFVDTPQVVSGLGGFLFSRKSFRRFSCDFPAISHEETEPIEAAIALAEAAKIRLFLVVSPNKATVHTEHLGGRTEFYSRCYFQKSREQRDAYKRVSNRFYVDHLQSVQQLRSSSGEGYFRGDTHWKEHMSLAIIQDLYVALLGIDPEFLKLPVEYGKVRRGGDLERQLIIARMDLAMKPDIWALEKRLLSLDKVSANTVILHDSFYQNKKQLISKIFEQVTFIHLEDAEAAFSEEGRVRGEFFSAVENAENIIVSVAERNVRSRLRKLAPYLEAEMLRRSHVLEPAGPSGVGEEPETFTGRN